MVEGIESVRAFLDGPVQVGEEDLLFRYLLSGFGFRGNGRRLQFAGTGFKGDAQLADVVNHAGVLGRETTDVEPHVHAGDGVEAAVLGEFAEVGHGGAAREAADEQGLVCTVSAPPLVCRAEEGCKFLRRESHRTGAVRAVPHDPTGDFAACAAHQFADVAVPIVEALGDEEGVHRLPAMPVDAHKRAGAQRLITRAGSPERRVAQ